MICTEDGVVHLRLATKVSLTLIGVLALGIMGSVQALLVARKTSLALEGMIADNVPSVRAAMELEIALLEQRGLASSYILDDGSARWLAELQAKKASFAEWQRRAEETAHTEEEHAYLNDLAEIYVEYDRKRDEVISLFERGQTGRATAALLDEWGRLLEQPLSDDELALAKAKYRGQDAMGRQTCGQIADRQALVLGHGLGMTYVQDTLERAQQLDAPALLAAAQRRLTQPALSLCGPPQALAAAEQAWQGHALSR